MKICLGIAIMVCTCAGTAAQTNTTPRAQLSLNGYLNNSQIGYVIRDIDSVVSLNMLHNRLNINYSDAGNFAARIDIRTRLFYGEQAQRTLAPGGSINQTNHLLDLSHFWVNNKSLVWLSEIDRLAVQYTANAWNVTMGRQRINWGITNVWNPNDIFNAYNFLDVDYQERPGNDAIRIQYDTSDRSQIELAVKPSTTKNQHTAAVLWRYNKWRYDFQVLGGIWQTDYVLGCGWAGNIKSTGFKGEISYFTPRREGLSYNNVSISAMADQTFTGNWYISLSALYNSRPADFFWNENLSIRNLSAKSLFPFTYTIYGTVAKTISPIFASNLSIVYAPEKNTFLLMPTCSWNGAPNFDIDFTAQAFFAEQNQSYNHLITQIFIRSRWSF